jgi:Rrf2 family protein
MLNVNKKLEIALRAIKVIRTAEKPMRSQDIAEKAGVSRSFLEQVVYLLGRAGITKSHRGPGGGITMNSTTVNVLDVSRALGIKERVYESPEANELQNKINETLSQINL